MGVVVGEVAQVALHLEQRPLDPGAGRAAAAHLLAEPHGIEVGRAVDQGGRLDHELAHRGVGGAGRGQQVHGPDDVDLVQAAPAHAGRVDDQEGVHDGVDLGGLDYPGQDGIALIGPHVLGALQRDGGLGRVQPHDDVDVGVPLQGLGHAPAPEGPQPGDQDPPAHLSRTTRCAWPAASRRGSPGG